VGDDPCGGNWARVTCEQGREGLQVVGLDLSLLEFKGPLPETLGHIELIKSIRLDGNE